MPARRSLPVRTPLAATPSLDPRRRSWWCARRRRIEYGTSNRYRRIGVAQRLTEEPILEIV